MKLIDFLKALHPSTRINLWSIADEKMVNMGTAIEFLTILEKENHRDEIVSNIVCGPNSVNIYLKV